MSQTDTLRLSLQTCVFSSGAVALTYTLISRARCTTRVECHRVLGIVATRRGDAAAAEVAFLAGAEDARGCGLYLLELLCARDLVQFVYEGQGRAAEGEAMIEAAAGRMGKERADFDALLSARREW